MRNLIILIIVPTLFASCASRLSVARLTSESENVTWEQGRQIVKTGDEDFTMFTVFERSENYDAIFDVEIFNHSSQTILVDPLRFYYNAYTPELSDITKVGTNHAIDPEVKLLAIQQDINQVDADVKNEAATGVAMFAAGVALTVATAALMSDAAGDGVEVSPVIMFDDEVDTEAEASYRVSQKQGEYDYWANQVLRKTTLKPGESVRGSVYFKIDFEAQKYLFHFPLGTQELQVEYKQQLY